MPDCRTGPAIAIAVNADSMSTWFTAVFEQLPEVLFDLRIEDQDHSARLLREGVVMGAVTTERTPVPGCRVQALGRDALPAGGSAGLRRASSTRGFSADAVASAPSLAWNRDDALQDMLVRKVFRRSTSRPTHFVPTAEGFGAAVRAGLGWGMYPEQIVDDDFVRVCDAHLDVPLYLAVLEARQRDGRTHHRGGLRGGGWPTAAGVNPPQLRRHCRPE